MAIDPKRRISSFSNEPVEKPKVVLVPRERRSGFDITGGLVRLGFASSRSGAVFILIFIIAAMSACTFLYLDWALQSQQHPPTRAQMNASMKKTMGDRAFGTPHIK